jgi:NADPH:quinone reductase-like Zn-dependent oxidoreductase
MTERARLTKICWEDDLAIETNGTPLAEPIGNQVLVEVEACGVCFYAVAADIPAAEAAVLHCTFGTAYRGLARFGGVESGQQVLITGANGGVGSAAVQVASRLGATVTAVTRDESHREYLSQLGAEHVIVDAGGRPR